MAGQNRQERRADSPAGMFAWGRLAALTVSYKHLNLRADSGACLWGINA